MTLVERRASAWTGDKPAAPPRGATRFPSLKDDRPFVRCMNKSPLTPYVVLKPTGRYPSPFTTSMTDDHALSAVSAEMNKCLKLGSGEGRANVRNWVSPQQVGRGSSRPTHAIHQQGPEERLFAKPATHAARNQCSALRPILANPLLSQRGRDLPWRKTPVCHTVAPVHYSDTDSR